MRNPPTQTQAQAIARKLKECLLQKSIPVESVYLFGSIATEEQHQDSDIDIAVVYRPFGENYQLECDEIYTARTDYSLPIDIVCLYPEDLENPFSTLASEIQTSGIKV